MTDLHNKLTKEECDMFLDIANSPNISGERKLLEIRKLKERCEAEREAAIKEDNRIALEVELKTKLKEILKEASEAEKVKKLLEFSEKHGE